MNTCESSRNRRRGYNNALREEHARNTRDRILEAVAAALAEGGTAALSTADVAARSGVSEPTIYRNFPNREALIEALEGWLRTRLLPPPPPDTPDGIPALLMSLFEYYEENAPLIRASMETGFASDVRAVGRRKRTERVRQLLAPETAHLDPREAYAVVAMFRVLGSSETWKQLLDEYQLDSSEGGRVVGWAAGAFLDALRRGRKEKRTKLVSEETMARARTLRKKSNGGPKEG